MSSPTATTRSSSTTCADLGISYDCFTRTTTRNHYRVIAGHLPDAVRQGLSRRADDARRVLPRDGPHAARPLHRGDVPDLRLPGGARRPVRQLRQPARSRRPDRPALDHRRLDAGVPRDDAPVPRPAGVRGAARASGSRRRRTGGRTSRTSRSASSRELKPRAMTRDIDWGVPVPVDGLPGGHEAHLRLVRRGDRLPLRERRVGARTAARPRRGASGGRTPTRATSTSWARTTSSSTRSSGRRCCSATAPAASSAPAGRPPAAVQRRRERVPDDGAARRRARAAAIAIWVTDFLDRYDPDPLRYYLTAAGPETQDTDFTWEEFVRRTNDELLANWGNLVNRTLVNAHRNFGAVPEPGALTEGDRALLDAVDARIRRRSASNRAAPASGPPSRRRWRRARSRTSTSPTRRRGRS